MKLSKFCQKCNKTTRHNTRKQYKNKEYCIVCQEKITKKSRIKNWWAYLARKANSRKLEGSEKLTKEDIENLAKNQNFLCALTNSTLDPNSKWWKPSLDRIDSSKGYYIKNLRIVAWIVNHCRGNLTDKEFIHMCNKVASAYHKYPYTEFCVLTDLND